MGNFFSIDGPFQKYGTIVADIIIISMLWYVLSIPLFTIGAVTTGMFYVFTKQANERDEYLIRPFFRSIKNNFIQATIITIILFLVYSILFFNIRIVGSGLLDLNSIFTAILYVVQISILIEFFIVSLYVFPVLSRFELKVRDVFKTSFYLANRHLLTTITLIGLFIIIFFLIFGVHPMFIMAAPGMYGYFASKFLVIIFKKYRPNMDKYEDAPDKNEPRDDLARRVIESGTYNRYIPEENTEDTSVETLENSEIKETSPVTEKENSTTQKDEMLENKPEEEKDIEETKEEFDMKYIMSKEDLKKRK